MSDIIWIALALVLVLEGLIPAANPALYRRLVQMLGERDDATIRRFGLGMIGLGAIIVFLVKS